MKNYRPPRDQQIFIRVDAALKRWITRQSIIDGRSMNSWIVRQIEAIRKKTPPARS